MDLSCPTVLGGLLAFFNTDTYFSSKRSKINNALYKLSQNPKYNDLFLNFEFSSDPWHDSCDVDYALDSLVLSRLLSAENPDLVKYKITENLCTYYTSHSAEFFESNVSLIKDASEELKKMLRV